MKAVNNLLAKKEYKDFALFTTGHSLGGALAPICSVQMADRFPHKQVQCINFGSPHVGNNSFKKLVMRPQKMCSVGISTLDMTLTQVELMTNLSIWRFVNKDDIVQCMPVLSYTHVGHTVHLTDNGRMDVLMWHKDSGFFNWIPCCSASVSDHSSAEYVKMAFKDFKVSQEKLCKQPGAAMDPKKVNALVWTGVGSPGLVFPELRQEEESGFKQLLTK